MIEDLETVREEEKKWQSKGESPQLWGKRQFPGQLMETSTQKVEWGGGSRGGEGPDGRWHTKMVLNLILNYVYVLEWLTK